MVSAGAMAGPARRTEKSSRNAVPVSTAQEELVFPGSDDNRGNFGRTDRNLFEGQDLDVPTYLRKGIKISL